jgi:hypothetical protein
MFKGCPGDHPFMKDEPSLRRLEKICSEQAEGEMRRIEACLNPIQ